MRKYLKEEAWSIVEEGFDPELQEASESIFSIGNGKMGQRANFEEAYSGPSLQGSYIAGVYYPDKTRVGWWKNGYPKYFAKVINSINWIGIDVAVNGIALDLATCEVRDFTRILDMRRSILSRRCDVALADGSVIRIESERFLSYTEDELGLIRYSMTPLSGDAEIVITPYLDGAVSNRDSNYGETFWEEVSRGVSDRGGYVEMKTKKLDFQIIGQFEAHLSIDGTPCEASRTTIERESYVGVAHTTKVKQGSTLLCEKYCAVMSTLYHARDALLHDARSLLSTAVACGYESLKEAHEQAWGKKWDRMDIRIEGDVAAQQGVRFNILQLNHTYTGRDERLNIGPKGFTGEKYGGSTYWDTEAYCLPFYLSTSPASVPQQFLRYRYRQLDKAIENAKLLGFSGGAALFPMVTMNGEECHNEWEITFEEIHRNGAIAYAIFNYMRYTGERSYLEEGGLEVLIAIARFWAQRVNWSAEKERYVILGVTGPNEYENNINNNWYTNYIASWCLRFAADSIDEVSSRSEERLKHISHKVALDAREPNNWREIASKMYLPYCEKRQIFLQQEGYLDKEQRTAAELDPSERPINQHWSWDRILRSCFIKQADTLQGFYFFEDDFSLEEHRRHFEFYEPRTVHESSLSPCVHVVLASKLGLEETAYELYQRTARLDLDDYNCEVHEGLHITSMAGTWMSVVYGFGGMRVQDDTLSFAPLLPAKWESFSFTTGFRGRTLTVACDKEKVVLTLLEGEHLEVAVYGERFLLSSTKPLEYVRK